MMSLGQRLIASAKEARAYVNGEDNGCVVHIPDEIDTARIRRGMGMNQEQFAVHFGLDVGIVQDWETGRAVPTGPARVLIRVIDMNPEAVRCALAGSAAG
jgi:putative transcriptional regulator